MHTNSVHILITGFIVVLLAASCNENLPSRNDPKSPLNGFVEFVNTSAYDTTAPAFSSIIVNPEYTVYLHTINTYDETFDGVGAFNGMLELESVQNPKIRKTLKFDKTSLVENRRYKFDPVTNTLTLDPGHELVFFTKWNLHSDDNIKPDSLFPLRTDYDCFKLVYLRRGKVRAVRYWNPRKYWREEFFVSGYLKPFLDLAAVQIPRQKVIIEYSTFNKSDCRSLPGSRN